MSSCLGPIVIFAFLLLVGLNIKFSIINSNSNIDKSLAALVESVIGVPISLIIFEVWISTIRNRNYISITSDNIFVGSGFLAWGILVIAHLLLYNLKKYKRI